MKQKIHNVDLMESPSYQITNEDGAGSDWCYLIVGEVANGKQYTHHKSFERYEENQARALVDKINAAGYMDDTYWIEGTPWDYYKTPQTYQEEKEEALFNEYN